MRFLLIALFATLRVTATDTLVVRNARMLTIDEGLSQGYIFSMHQDRFGFIWMCSKDGLNRYDGNEFVVYNHDPADPATMRSNGVTSLTEDTFGHFWLTFYGTGIDLFVRSWNVFLHAEELFPQYPELAGATVEWLMEASPGEIWCQTSEGLFRIRITPKNPVTEHERTGNAAERFRNAFDVNCTRVLGKTDVHFNRGLDSHIFRDNQNNWYITKRTQVYAVDFTSTDPFAEELFSGYFSGGTEKYSYVSLVHSAEWNYFILGDQALRYSRNPAEAQSLTLPFRMVSSEQGLCIKGNTLLALDEATRLVSIDLRTLEGSLYRFEFLKAGMDFQSSFSTLLLDRDGNTWLGTTGLGVLFFNDLREHFHYALPEQPVSPSTYLIREDVNGELLIVVHMGVLRFDPKKGKFSSLLSGAPLSAYKTDTIIARAFLPENDGSYWMVKDRDLRYWKKGAPEIVFRHDPGVHYSELFPLVRDDDALWFCSYDSLYQWSAGTRKMTTRRALPMREKPGYTPSSVHALLVDKGRIWLGTVDGFWEYETGSDKWTEHFTGLPHSASDHIFWILRDRFHPDTLWLGTNGGGLIRFSSRNKTSQRYTQSQGLSNNVVYAVLQDDSGCLWMSTNRGLCRLNPETGLVRSYTVNDGLQSNEFNRYSAYRAADGTMYFGGVNGLTWFHPSEVAQGSVIPAIVITDLIGINGPVLGADGWPVDPLTARQLVLQSADAMLRIRFTALDFFAADRLIYRYKLDGLHEQWIDLGRSRELTFPDLPPGTYTLRLAASSGDGNWTEQENGMIITIRPAWYATWLFRLLVLALAVALVIYIYRIRVRRMVELQRIRDHIARDLHDEIGSSLSSISIYSKVVMENSERPVKDLLPVLQRIRETSQRMMESMSDIVWAINTRHDDWPQLIQRMRAAAIELTEARNMQLRFHADDIPERIPLDMEKRRNIYLLFKEAVNNSVKYANATSLDVRLERQGDVMRLEISDNGVGFRPEQVKGGNGLVNMNTRAAMLGGILRIESSPGQGTRITLELK